MIEIRVIGTPGPQGSKRFVGRGVMIESSKKVKPWREAVVWAAREAAEKVLGPVICEMVFSLQRPKSEKKSVTVPAKKPDLSKLVRSTEDALTDAGAWEDDARVVGLANTRKVFAGGSDPDALDVPGAVIRIWSATPAKLTK